MRRFATSLMLAGLTLAGLVAASTIAVADTPLKGGPAAFGSSAAKPQPPVTQSEKLLLIKDKQPAPAVVEAKKPAVDYIIKAASIEVAWLQDPITYPLHLRADTKPGEDFITLTGYVPHEKLREKALAVARQTVGNLIIQDQIAVHSQMALPGDAPVEKEQAFLVQVAVEKAVPGITQGLQIKVDAQGVTTVSGRVDEFDDRRKIIRALQGIPGCTAIRYDLRVMSMATIHTAAATVPAPAAPTAPVVLSPAITTPAAITEPVVIQAPVVKVTPVTPAATPAPAPVSVGTPVKAPAVLVPVVKMPEPITTPDFPALPSASSITKHPNGAPPILLPVSKKEEMPVVVKPATPAPTTTTTVPATTEPAKTALVKPAPATTPSVTPVPAKTVPVTPVPQSLSGMFPPGMSSGVSDSCTTTCSASAILIGSPVVIHTSVVQTSPVMTVNFSEPVEPAPKVVTKRITISTASYTQAFPATKSVEAEFAPELISVMPRVMIHTHHHQP